ncbi:hypothetical protein G6F42_026710 [Rhizopus arrhizus]|nr:hypothetical protein G6F42_026710 [Rhizopus arrhizus]
MYTQYSRWFFKNKEELFRTLNRHRLTAEEGVLSVFEEDGGEAVVSEVDPITAVAAVAIETDDDFLMTGISSIGNLGFDFINDVVIATIAEPFTLDTGAVG